jgi:hopene-associated glycosyltransferase HpnB
MVDALALIDGVSALPVAIWLYLLVGRGWFWLGQERDRAEPVMLPACPRIAAVIPARNEAETIAEVVGSLLRQDYGGNWTLFVVDDDSSDGTAAAARRAAAAAGREGQLTVVTAKPLPRGWTGKLWAVKQGVEAATAMADPPEYLLLTDADIVHDPDTLSSLAGRAVSGGLVLTSLMAKLRCATLAERIHVPAFIFFFQMLYPFSWVNRADGTTAAAAGGCMLVRADTLAQAGGIDAIRTALIDDCTLAELMKRHGRIWLGLTERVRSIRPYPGLNDFRRMVSRSAYAQLRFSPLLLLGTIAAMTITFIAPPLFLFFGTGLSRAAGLAAWTMMAIAFQPTLSFYRVPPLWGIALPAIAFLYMVYTVDSAVQFARGKGGLWKGRVQATRS